MPRTEHRLLTLSTVATVIVALAAALAGHVEAVAYAAPCAVLVLPLLGGRYVGEDRIARLRARDRSRPRVRAARVLSPVSRSAVVSVARGGRLIARSLAVRPPPVRVFS
jgi:hypothetical protein